MEKSITEYVPKRDILGRFRKPLPRKVKIIFVLMAIGSFALNWYLWRANYVVRCKNPLSAAHQYVGSFMSKQTCDDIVSTFAQTAVSSLPDSEVR